MNFPRISGHRVKPQGGKFRILAALHNQAQSDVFFGCRRFRYSKMLMGNAIEPFHDHRNGATL